MNDKEQYDEWTPCQMYGHIYERDDDNPNRYVCKDCKDSYEEEPGGWGISNSTILLIIM